MAAPVQVLHCAFCGRLGDDVDDLIAGATVHICGECICLGYDIVKAARKRRAEIAARIRAEVEISAPASP